MTTLANPSETRAAASDAPPQLAEGVELLGEMPGSGYRQAPALVRRGDGQTLQLTPLLYGVLEAVDGVRGPAEIATELSEKIGKAASADDVSFLLEKKLRPLGVLIGADGTSPVAPKANPLLALRPRVAVSNPDVTRRLTGPFARLFAWWIAVPMTVAFFVLTAWVLFAKGLGTAAHQAFYEPGLLLAIFGLTVLSAGVHEFGHAAACRYGGATPGTMGFGLYIVFPAFYTDVTDSYRLDRRRRLWVDLGGLYFNAILCVASVALWWATGWDALLLLVGTQVLQMLRQLTPVIRADGYHILADITGVPDLFAHLKPTVLSLWPGNWGNRDSRTLKRWARVVVIVWVILIVPSLVFALVSGAVALPRLVATAWDSLGVQGHTLAEAAGAGHVPTMLLAALKMLAVALPVAGTLLMLGRVASRTVRSQWAKGADAPRRRVLTVVAVGAIVLVLGWFWWPRQQYTPIGPDERGTVLDLASSVRAASAGAAAPFAGTGVSSGARVPALILVPQDAGNRPALVVLRSSDGGPATVLSVDPGPGAGAGAGPNRWPFPFPPPGPAAPGGSRAVSITTADGTANYDVAFSMVWVTGNDVHTRNDAIALASCTHCTSVAVAFQTVFLLGQDGAGGTGNTIAPINTSQALNYACRDCRTTAIAVQLVVSLTSLPDAATSAQLAEIWKGLDQLSTDLPHLSDAEIYARLKGIEQAILTTLAAAGPTISDSSGSTSAAGSSGSAPANQPTVAPSAGSATTTPSSPRPSAQPGTDGTAGSGGTEPGTVEPSSSAAPAAPDATPSPATSDQPTGSSPQGAATPAPGATGGTTTTG
ncbi:MAG: putative peptide zinc metalloprotease protein [Frankiaceae bacterium]|nr:putative peptide zinc metalloprotease protein [Frankiaceae bacterium]